MKLCRNALDEMPRVRRLAQYLVCRRCSTNVNLIMMMIMTVSVFLISARGVSNAPLFFFSLATSLEISAQSAYSFYFLEQVVKRTTAPKCRAHRELSQGWGSPRFLGLQVSPPRHGDLLFCGFQGPCGRAGFSLEPGLALFFFHIFGARRVGAPLVVELKDQNTRRKERSGGKKGRKASR